MKGTNKKCEKNTRSKRERREGFVSGISERKEGGFIEEASWNEKGHRQAPSNGCTARATSFSRFQKLRSSQLCSKVHIQVEIVSLPGYILYMYP